MKRCMCGKPNCSINPDGVSINFFYPENTLHFKAVDRECERCGRPLCEDCKVQQLKIKRIKQTGLHFTWFEAKYVTRCPICAEVI